MSQALHERIYKFIKKHLDRGFQAYIVCPLVEEGDSDLIPAQEYYKLLQNTAFRGYRLGLLHGQMKPKEKDNIMRDFESGKIQLLVSTVVIEVGVDVPNAVVMVIEMPSDSDFRSFISFAAESAGEARPPRVFWCRMHKTMRQNADLI